MTNTTENLTTTVVEWEDQKESLRAIRERVFIEEQQVPREIEWDGQDENATHVLSLLQSQTSTTPVACGRLLEDGKIGRMAVLSHYRGRGYGRAVLDALIDAAKEQGKPSVYLHAQSHASDFYAKAGFEPYDEPFEEAGIPHIAMQRTLDYRKRTTFLQGVAYPHPFDELAIGLCQTASRHLCILSPTLDSKVFDNRELTQALSALARRGRQSQIRILVQDSRAIVQRGHRLLELSRRLPTKIKLHKLAEHPDWKGQTVIIRDRDGVLFKPGDTDHKGFYEPDSPSSTLQHLDLFDELWRHSAQDVEFRSMGL
ncbi:MAG: GNAT family N-acetyltransferase [Halioglobus sp.]